MKLSNCLFRENLENILKISIDNWSDGSVFRRTRALIQSIAEILGYISEQVPETLYHYIVSPRKERLPSFGNPQRYNLHGNLATLNQRIILHALGAINVNGGIWQQRASNLGPPVSSLKLNRSGHRGLEGIQSEITVLKENKHC